MDALVAARDGEVMALAAETGDIGEHVRVGWWRCIEGREGSDPIRAGADWPILPERR